MSHRVTIHKHTFPTIKEAASHFGMPRETLSRKVNGGMSAEDAVNSYLLKKKNKASRVSIKRGPIVCAGKEYPTHAAFARALKMPESELRQLLGKGLTPEKIAQDVLLPSPDTHVLHKKKRIDVKKTRSLIVNGVKYANAREMANDYDMPVEVVKDRVDKAWAASQAVGLTPPPDGRAPTLMPIDYNGKYYNSIVDLSEDLKLCISDLVRRVNAGEGVVKVIEDLITTSNQPGPSPLENKPHKHTKNTLSLKISKTKKADNVEPIENAEVNKDIVYQGETYRSEGALASAYRIPIATFMMRRAEGESISDILNDVPLRSKKSMSRKGAKRKALTVEGESYRSVASLGRAFNIAPHRIRYCIERGGDVAALIAKHNNSTGNHHQKNGNKRQEIVYAGKVYKTITDLANAYGIKPNTLASRLRKGKSLKEAVGGSVRPDNLIESVKARQNKKVSYTVGELTFYSLTSLAEHFNVSEDAVAHRLAEGITPAEAVGQLAWRGKPGQGKTITIAGYTFPSIKAAATFYGVSYPTLRRRLSDGDLPEVAVGASRPKQLQVGHHSFSTITAFAEYYKLDPDVTQRRMLAGWTAAEILGDALPPRERYVS